MKNMANIVNTVSTAGVSLDTIQLGSIVKIMVKLDEYGAQDKMN